MNVDKCFEYIGQIIKYEGYNVSAVGCAFLIDGNRVITAKHNLESMCDEVRLELMLNGRCFPIIDRTVKDIHGCDLAVLSFDETLLNEPDASYRFNISRLSDDETSKWEIAFYQNGRKKSLSGMGIRPYFDDEKELFGVSRYSGSIEGASGSPAIVNGVISGVVVVERVRKYEQSAELQTIAVVPLSAAAYYIPDERVERKIFNNRAFEKIDYSDRVYGYSEKSYIERVCEPMDSGDEFLRDEKTLVEAICSDERNGKNIVLVGNAGIGKTFELINAAVRFGREGEYYPLYFSLNELSDFNQLIELETEYNSNRVPFCFFIDGLDDIKDREVARAFSEKFPTFARNFKGKKALTVVSVKTDFFSERLFEQFYRLSLCPLSTEQIKEECECRGISGEAFLDEAERKGVLENASYPFYLGKLIDIYKDEKSLPKKHELMERIIDYTLRECFLEHGDLGEGLAERNNIGAKRSLSKLALAFFMLGGKNMDDGVYNMALCDGKVREVNTIKYCGLLTSKDGKRHFVHGNFYEYLVARELNERFPDDIDEIKRLLCDSEGNFLPENAGITEFLISMRKNGDLLEWLVNNGEDNIKFYENDRLSKGELEEQFKRIFERFTADKMRVEVDGSSSIEKWAVKTDCPVYLIEKFRGSASDIERSNAGYLLSLRSDLSDFGEEIRTAAVEILSGRTEDIRLLKNAVKLLTALKINDVCDVVMKRLGGIDDELIIGYLCHYLAEVGRADDYVDDIINMIDSCRRNRYMYATVVECVASFRRLESYIRLFEYVIGEGDDVRRYYSFGRLFDFEVTDGFTAAYLSGGDRTKARQLIERIAVSGFHQLRQKKIMGFFSDVGCEDEAIGELFDLTRERPYEFVMIAGNFDCFADFIMEKYTQGEFDEDSARLLLYMKNLNEDSPVRAQLLNFLRGRDEKYAGAIVEYFDNREKSANELKLIRLGYIFDFGSMKEEISAFIRSQGEDDLGYRDYSGIIYNESRINTREYTAFSLAVSYLGGSDSVMTSLNSINENEFFIREFESFVDSNSDYLELVTPEQLDRVKAFCEEYINNTDFESAFVYRGNGFTSFINANILTAVIKLIKRFELKFSKDKLLDMLFIPTYFFNEGSDISEYFDDKLTVDDIADRIRFYLENKNFDGDLAEKSLIYCAEHEKIIPELCDKAAELLKEGTATFLCPKAFEYLIAVGSSRRVITLVNSDKIKPKVVINNLHKLKEEGLKEYCGILFDKYFELREKLLSGQDFAQLAADNSELIESEFANSSASVQGAIERDMRSLFDYLVEYNSERHIELYLDYMIKEKRSSFLDQNEWQMNIRKIHSEKYTNKLFEIFKLLYSGEFETRERYSTLAFDIEKVIFAIADDNRRLIFDKINELAASERCEFRRAAGELKRRLLINVKYSHQNTPKDVVEYVFGKGETAGA